MTTTRVYLNIPGTRYTCTCRTRSLWILSHCLYLSVQILAMQRLWRLRHKWITSHFLKWEESLLTLGKGSISPSSVFGGFYLSVSDLSCLLFEGPGEAEMYLEKHHCYSHILPCLCHSSCLALHLAKWPFMCVAPRFMSAPLLWTSQSWRCFLAPAERSRRHPAAVLMRFFLGFDGVPVALPLL